MARRYLSMSPDEWAALSWAMQRTYVDGFYTEGLLERPEGGLDGDMTVPDDIRSLTAEGSGYRTAEAPVVDLDSLIGELEAKR